MENKLKISENTVVHCVTEELADEVLRIAGSLGYTWNDSKSYIEDDSWGTFETYTCYNLHAGTFGDSFSYNNMNYNIISAQDFIALHKEESLLKKYADLMNDYDLELYKLESKILNTGIKESDGKLNYELDWEFIQAMAERMSKNKHKYKPYNWKLPIDVESLKQSLFRHVIEVMKGNYEDDGMELGHVLGVALNAMMIHYQLKYNDKIPENKNNTM